MVETETECARCGAVLDVRLFAEIGIGPWCIYFWFDGNEANAMKAAAREALRARGLDPAERIAG